MLFVGRATDVQSLERLPQSGRASLAVVYGRRRAGTTTLIEHVFGNRKLLKFEGIQDQPKAAQISNFMETLRSYFPDRALALARPTTWKQCFELLGQYTQQGVWTIYFEELQWIASYKHELIAELKPVWDNSFQRNPELVLILCGSAPSFFIKNVIRSQALYNRTSLELLLEEFPINDVRSFLPTVSNSDYQGLFEAYLSVGGIPLYLQKLSDKSSPYLSLCHHASSPHAFFVEEFDKIFVSSFGSDPTYRKIIEFIAKNQSVSRSEILSHLALQSGGTVSDMITDLDRCGFIRKITPLSLNPKSRLARYRIQDAYLQFYYMFIEPKLGRIQAGDFRNAPTKLVPLSRYWQSLGFAFERYCLHHTYQIAHLLDFGAIDYTCGSYYQRTTPNNRGVQIDLLFQRADRVMTVCEIKYTREPVGTEVISSVEQKIHALGLEKKRIHRVLLSAVGATDAVIKRNYFDRIITLKDLLAAPRL